MHSNLEILLIFSIGLVYALVFSYIAQRLNLSLISGYLLAGYMIGPYSPGYVADLAIAEQLAEIGIILMLFGVGMHFNWDDLIRVKNVAIPGAIIQTLIATLVTMLFFYIIGWNLLSGAIIGLSIGVASTVVMVKVLTDQNLINTLQGHIAIGWLVVEDFLTVLILLLLPALSAFSEGIDVSILPVMKSIVLVLLKFALLITFMFTIGQWIVSYILEKISNLDSKEMFTLAVLALVLLIATGSAAIFNTSIPLGAFIAGVVIGRTKVKHKAAANALPFRDIFSIIFFLAVGMLFDPKAIYNHFFLFLGIFGIIMIVKPATAYLITKSLGYTRIVSLTVGLSLAQIGEFSFILAEEASVLKILPDEGYDIIVAAALISIILNPFLFRWLRAQT